MAITGRSRLGGRSASMVDACSVVATGSGGRGVLGWTAGGQQDGRRDTDGDDDGGSDAEKNGALAHGAPSSRLHRPAPHMTNARGARSGSMRSLSTFPSWEGQEGGENHPNGGFGRTAIRLGERQHQQPCRRARKQEAPIMLRSDVEFDHKQSRR